MESRLQHLRPKKFLVNVSRIMPYNFVNLIQFMPPAAPLLPAVFVSEAFRAAAADDCGAGTLGDSVDSASVFIFATALARNLSSIRKSKFKHQKKVAWTP
jgi:hypothetical protein